MHCTTCDYPLWNLKARECPECGAPFRPSEFEFVPNSIRFCCPHCDQPYYGTDARGHLVPSAFVCVGCGAPIDMDGMVLRPAAGIAEERTRPDPMPWLERRAIGRARAWFSMIGLALVRPGRLMRGVPPQSTTWQAWWFALVTQTLITLASLVPLMVLMVFPVFLARAARPSPPGLAYIFGTLSGAIGVTLAFGIVAGLVSMLIWGAVAHGILAMTGGTGSGIGRTYQAICYSSGANILTAVPCLGWYFGWVWWVVSSVLMIKEAHRVRAGRAAAAAITFPVILVILMVFAWGASMAFSMASARAASSASRTLSTQGETGLLAAWIAGYASVHGGRGPTHAAQLVLEQRSRAGSMTRNPFVSDHTWTSAGDVPIGDTTLDEFMRQSPVRQTRTVQEAADALPPDVVAYRVGDFVFTYPGLDFGAGDPALWIVVMCPDPVANPEVAAGTEWIAGRSDWTARVIPAASASVALREQNALRAAHGLPPLADPATITHDAPQTRQ